MNGSFYCTAAPPELDEVAKPVKDWIHELITSDSLSFSLLRMVVIIAITFVVVFLYRKIDKIVRRRRDEVGIRFFHNVVSAMLYIIGFVTAFSNFPPFKSALNYLFAGSGIAALAIGLAAQESLGNAINGIFISVFKPFDIGDRITLINGKTTGVVEDITLRHTVVRTYTSTRILIPNTTINKDMIENSNFQNDKVSAFIDILVTYDSDIGRAQEIIAEVIGSHPLYLDNREPDQMDEPMVPVFVRELALQGASLRASMWSRSTSDNFIACSDARRDIIRRFSEEGIRIATVIGPLEPIPPPEEPEESEESKSESKRKKDPQ